MRQAKSSLEEQRQNWQAEAARRQVVIHSQGRWVVELEQVRAWLEAKRGYWETEAGHCRDIIEKQ